jgi:hypothetical protein
MHIPGPSHFWGMMCYLDCNYGNFISIKKKNMKKLLTILSPIFIGLGLKAQTPVIVRKETTPQIKPQSAGVQVKSQAGDSISRVSIKDPHVKKTTTFKNSAVNDSVTAHEGIKGATIKQAKPVDKTIKFDKNTLPMKETPIKK